MAKGGERVKGKRAFPEWMCRMSPFLRRADEDVLFLYFRERARSGKWWQRMLPRGVSTVLLFLMIMVFQLLRGVTGLNPGRLILGAVIAYFAWVFITDQLSDTKQATTGLDIMADFPSDLTEIDSNLATDLWMSGVTGSELYRAMSFSWVWGRVAVQLLGFTTFAFLLGIITLLLLGIVSKTDHGGTYSVLICSNAILVLSLLIQYYIRRFSTLGMRHEELIKYREEMMSNLLVGYRRNKMAWFKKTTKKWLSLVVLVVLVMLVYLGVILTLAYRSTLFPGMGLRNTLILIFVSTSLILLLYNFRYYRGLRLYWINVARQYIRDRNSMDRVGDLAMRLTVFQDEDWRHGSEDFLDKLWKEKGQ